MHKGDGESPAGQSRQRGAPPLSSRERGWGEG